MDSSGKIYVADQGDIGDGGNITASVFVYSARNYYAAPIATISGSNTGLNFPVGIALDFSGKIYVADQGNIGDGGSTAASLFVYPALGSNTGLLNEASTATISGSNTGLNYPGGIALDSSSKIYVAEPGDPPQGEPASVGVYSAGSNGNVAPIASISESNTGLNYPEGIALDSSGKIYVVDDGPHGYGPGSVFVYSAGSNGNSAPIATISGNNTGLIGPHGIGVDSSGKIYVVAAAGVSVYSAGSNGDVAPVAVIRGASTRLSVPLGIALDSSGKIYVADWETSSVLVYSALGSSTGLLDEAPIAIISGSSTGLYLPENIAVDSTGKIYVVASGGVFVYSAGSNGNVAPVATISGSSTGQSFPQGIAVDSSGNIYVADEDAASVLVYSAGSNGNVAPVMTIGGPNTELLEPRLIAIQPVAAAPTPMPTANATPPPTGAASPTVTPSPTTTVSPTVTATPRPTGSSTPTATATATSTIPTLLVTDGCTKALAAYPAAGNGDVSPLAPAPTGLAVPQAVAIDASGNIYVTNSVIFGSFELGPDCGGASYVTIYAAGSNGDAAPIAVIGGSNAGLGWPLGIAVDSGGKIYVANISYPNENSGSSVLVYSPGSNGNVAPIATISGSNTGLTFPRGVAVDSSGNIYVADPERRRGAGLFGGEQRQRRPHRHHQREQHRPAHAGRRRGGSQWQNLCGG